MSPILVFHDSRCGLCRATMQTLNRLDWLSHLEPVDIHDEQKRKRVAPDLTYEELDKTMHIRTPDGTTLTGFRAFRRLSHHLPLLWLLMPFLYLPGAAIFGEWIYGQIAERRRTCTHESCNA